METHESALYIHDWDTGIDIGCRSQGRGDIILISVEVGICVGTVILVLVLLEKWDFVASVEMWVSTFVQESESFTNIGGWR